MRKFSFFLLLVCVHVMAYRWALKNSTNLLLSNYFDSGIRCNSVLTGFPITSVAKRGEITESNCYLEIFQTQYLNENLEDQAAYLLQSLQVFTDAHRASDEVLSGLAWIVFQQHAVQKRGLVMQKDILRTDWMMIDQLLTIAENEKSSRNMVVRLVADYQKPIQDFTQEVNSREPMSESASEFQANAAEVAERYAKLKDLWIIQESEISGAIANHFNRQTL